MDLQRLRHFLAVAECMNLSQAAEKLGFSQPALSKSMTRLQGDLDVQLYVRKGRGIVLTDAGIALRGRAEAIIEQVDDAQLLMTDMRSGLAGHVRIGTGPSFLTRAIPNALADVGSEQPNVRYTIREGTTQELYAWVKAREIDFALLGWIKSDQTREMLDPELSLSRLLTDDLVIVTRAEHPLQLSPPRVFGDLAPYGWVLPRLSTKLNAELNRFYENAGEAPPSARVLTSSLFATCAILRRTNLMTIIARSGLSEVDIADIRPLEQRWLRFQRDAFLVTLKGMQLPAAASEVVERVRRLLAAR